MFNRSDAHRAAHVLSMLLTIVAGLLFAASQSLAAEPLRIGSKRFTESYILAEILAQTAAGTSETAPLLRQGLGNTAIVQEALRSGAIDMYVEYTGTISREILRSPQPLALPAMREELAKMGLGVAVPLGFNNGYALTMRADRAASLGIRSLSDLARHPELRLSLSNEFIGRADGWPALVKAYNLQQRPSGLDHGLAFDAIAQGRTDVIDIYTTDAQIAALALTVLDDDRHIFPAYDAMILYRLDVPSRFPEAWRALGALQGRISETDMIGMNRRAETEGAAFDVIAREYLRGASGAHAAQLASAPPAHGPIWWRKLVAPDLWRLTWQHVSLVLGSVLVAAALAVPAGVLVAARPRARAVVLGTTGLLQTIPSLAMLAVLITLTGSIGVAPALLALMLYALLPIMRNTCTGLAEVPPGLRTAALGLGMTPAQSKKHIELPLAMPAIVAGIRTATTICIGTATIAAFIGAGGYGERIVTGLALNDHGLLLAGAIPAAVLAMLCEGFFELLERRLLKREGAA